MEPKIRKKMIGRKNVKNAASRLRQKSSCSFRSSWPNSLIPSSARGRRPPESADALPGRRALADGGMRLFGHELRTEQLLFWRNREAAFFTFFLPIIFFLIFGSIYGDDRIAKEH